MGQETYARSIVSGPSKYDFHLALNFRNYPRQAVEFEVTCFGHEKCTRDVRVQIHLIQRFDEHEKLPGQEGHWWYFLASTIGSNDPDFCQRGTGFLRGMYSTKTRTGWIEELTLEQARVIDQALGAMLPTEKTLFSNLKNICKSPVGTGP